MRGMGSPSMDMGDPCNTHQDLLWEAWDASKGTRPPPQSAGPAPWSQQRAHRLSEGTCLRGPKVWATLPKRFEIQ
jgi:hypothetical protein